MSDPARVLTLTEVSVTRPDRTKPLLDTVSLTVDAGETVILLGEAESGKRALLRALNGTLDEGEVLSGTVRFGAQGESGQIGLGPLRVAYLPGPSFKPLSPNASAISQFSRVIARRIRAPQSSARAEFAQEIGRLSGAPPLAAFEKHAGDIAPETLAWGLLATAVAQTPGLLLVDHLFEGLPPREARVIEKALLAAKARLHCTLVCATMNTDTAIRLGGRLIVMRQGRIVEEGPLTRLVTTQAHAYTQTLFKQGVSRERLGARGQAVVQALGIVLPSRAAVKTDVRNRDELNFELCRGASLALVGEKGSGRRTLARMILGMGKLPKGRVVFNSVDIGILSSEMRTRLRRRVAMISGTDDVLDPRMSLWETVAEPLRAHLSLPRDVLAQYRDAALRRVGLASRSGELPIAALSVFDRRRLQVARAIVTAPALALIDEPLQGLDAFAQAVIRDLLQSFRDEEGPAFLVITSDFAVARALSEDAMVFKDGQIVERGAIAELIRAPKHPYTRSLVEASRVEPVAIDAVAKPTEKPPEKLSQPVPEKSAAAPQTPPAATEAASAPVVPLVEKTAASGKH